MRSSTSTRTRTRAARAEVQIGRPATRRRRDAAATQPRRNRGTPPRRRRDAAATPPRKAAATPVELGLHPRYDELIGDRRSHASPFARISELPDPPKIVQLGLRCMTPQLRAQAKRFDIASIEMRDFPETRRELRDALDRLLPAGAPRLYPAGRAELEETKSVWADSCSVGLRASPSFQRWRREHERTPSRARFL